MPLVPIMHELERAQAGHYAVPLFDTFDMHSSEGILLALAEKRAPGIIAIYDTTMDQPHARALAAYLRARAESLRVPVSLMLDHGRSFEQCIQALSWGCSDVMYDGSRQSLADNIAQTRLVVRAAHALGAGVEAELGHVGAGSEYQTYGAQRKGFTDPATAAQFVAETGVDFLAVAIGSAHGVYDGEPQLDVALLRQIRARVDIPLVLHGGSGCSEEQFRAVIEAGICKINITTDLLLTTARRMVEMARVAPPGEPVSYFDLSRAAVDAFRERCGYYLDVFGATGKGE